MKNDPLAAVSTRETPQNQPIPGRTDMVPNAAGGHAWQVDDWTQLRRFLILGTTGGTYYTSEAKLTKDNAEAVIRCVQADGARTVDEIVKVSTENLAPKVQPTIFALAVCAAASDLELTRARALDALPQVCRTGYHLFLFARYVEQFRGWGRGLRRAVAGWYTNRPVTSDDEGDGSPLALQVIKYQQREGWSHRDLLRLSHPETSDPRQRAIFDWVLKHDEIEPGLPDLVAATDEVQTLTDPKAIVKMVERHNLPWEVLPSESLKHPAVWEALLPKMGLTALIRNVGRLTNIGLIKPMANATHVVVDRISDRDALRRSRVHPFAVLLAQTTYSAGHGVKGSLKWEPVRDVTDALDAAFYAAFGNVTPSGKNVMLAIDISASMTWSTIAGSHITPRDGAGAMAMITAATEPSTLVTVFSSGSRRWNDPAGDGVESVDLSPRMRLDDVVDKMTRMPPGGTDCSLPMLYAEKHGLPIDTFVVYTDSETWAGQMHPKQALDRFRQKSGRDARSVVVGMESNGFTIADPKDPGMLDVVGFDASAPQLIADFARGDV